MPKLLIVATVAATLRAFLLPYVRHFRSRGWRVDALARDATLDPECRGAFDACHDAAFSRKPWALRDIRGLNNSIRALVTREGYDIVHTHTPVASFVTRLALRTLPQETRPKVVYTAHGFHFY
ncbi:MAG: glycosyltransferase, partial [Fretibacterium sp.]|nr:glycosyltransferase [Fretibacterium sp.]